MANRTTKKDVQAAFNDLLEHFREKGVDVTGWTLDDYSPDSSNPYRYKIQDAFGHAVFGESRRTGAEFVREVRAVLSADYIAKAYSPGGFNDPQARLARYKERGWQLPWAFRNQDEQ